MKVDITKVKNLVFKGGSVKGIAYIGCLTQLQKLGLNLSQVKQVIGTSAGSITALIVALNIYENPDELMAYLSKDFTEFLDMENETLKDRITKLSKGSFVEKSVTGSSVASEVSFFGENPGFASGELFREWIDKIIEDKTKIHCCTFEELGNCEDGKFKSLFVVAFDLTTRKPIVFSKTHTPNAIISDAIRSSISIPHIFKPHRFYCKNELGERVIPEGMENHQLIDGGIVMNYPIEVFDQPENSALPGEILGFYLTNPKEQSKHEQKYPPEKYTMNIHDDEDKNYTEKIYKQKKNGLTYSINVWKCHKRQGKEHTKYERENERTIYVDNLNVSSLEFNLNETTKGRLIDEGKRAVNQYFGFGPIVL